MQYDIHASGEFPLTMIDCMGVSADPKITRYGPARRRQYIMHYILKGRGFYNGNPVGEGQGFLITPGILEEYHGDPADPWEFLWVISTDTAMERVFSCCHADPDTLIFDYGDTAPLQNAAATVRRRSGTIVSRYEILEILTEILKSHGSSRSAARRTNAELYVDFAVNYIRTGFQNPITVEGLTDLLGVSQPYLYKIFRAATGRSPKQFLGDCRIAEAKKLLAETDMTVTQIANSVGYGDVLAFSKFFSSRVGMSPQRFRA